MFKQKSFHIYQNITFFFHLALICDKIVSKFALDYTEVKNYKKMLKTNYFDSHSFNNTDFVLLFIFFSSIFFSK